MSMVVFIILNCTFTFYIDNSHAVVAKKALLYNQTLSEKRRLLFQHFFQDLRKFSRLFRNFANTRDWTNSFKHNSISGNQVWVQSYNGPPNKGDSIKRIRVDSQGNIVVSGYEQQAEFCG
jgi:hypothetical protein